VDDAIQLGFDPAAPAPEPTQKGLAFPDGMRWLVDPDVAEQAGLLIRLPLPAGTTRIDRLFVLGVLGSLDGAGSAARVADLLVGHRHTRGLTLLPIATPSNNLGGQRSGFTESQDPLGSFEVERRTPPPQNGSDGALLAAALGIPVQTLQGVAHSGEAEQAAAGKRNALVWARGVRLLVRQPHPAGTLRRGDRRHPPPCARHGTRQRATAAGAHRPSTVRDPACHQPHPMARR
jgi:hypothetical protein